MLRSLKTPHLGALIRAFQVTTATPVCTVDVNAGDTESALADGAGKAFITPKEKLIRPGIVLCQAFTDIADGGYGTYEQAPSSDEIVAETLDASGSGNDGKAFIMSVDFWSENTDRCSPLQTVKTSSGRSPRMMGFHISSAAAMTIGGTQATVAKALSVYTLTFSRAFSRACMVWVTPIATLQKAARVTAVSASAASIATFSAAEAAEDNAFYALVLGWDSPDQQWGRSSEKAIQVPQLKPRMETFLVDGTGTAELDIGSGDATLVDNGTGDYSLTWTKPFARAPIVITTALSGRAQCLSAASTTGVNIGSFDAGGSAADDNISVLVLGMDSTMEI